MPRTLQSRVDRLALECQNAEDALVDSPEWLHVHEAIEPLDSERKFAQGQRPLGRQAPRAEPLQLNQRVMTTDRSDDATYGRSLTY